MIKKSVLKSILEDSKVVKNPRVSIILPVYNGAAYLEDTLQSVFGQSFAEFELIVLDDCSIDRSVELIRSFEDPRLVLHENSENLGQVKTENIGLELAKAPLVARLDQDDLFAPEKLAKQVQFLDQNPQVSVLGTWARRIDARGKRIKSIRTPEYFMDVICVLLKSNPFFHPSVMFRKADVLELGAYNESVELCEDFDLWCRMVQAGKIMTNLPEFLFEYRVHPGQASKTRKSLMRANVSAARKALIDCLHAQLALPQDQRTIELSAKQWAKVSRALWAQKIGLSRAVARLEKFAISF